MARHWDVYGGQEIANAARATWRACEATTKHAPLVDEAMAQWLEGVADGLHMMLDQLSIASGLPGHRRMPGVDPECQWMTQQAERERNRAAMIARQQKAQEIPARVDPDTIRDQAEQVILDALDGRELDGAAEEFVRLVGRLVAATERARTD